MAAHSCQFCGGNGYSTEWDKFYPTMDVDHKCYVALRHAFGKGMRWSFKRGRTISMWHRRIDFATGQAAISRPRRRTKTARRARQAA